MLLLSTVAIVMPVLRGHSTVFLAFTEGKQAIVYLLVIYCLVAQKSVHLLLLKQLLVVIGIILSLQVIAFVMFGSHPPGFLPIDPNFPGESRSIHIMYPLIISVALFLALFDKRLFPRPFSAVFITPVLAVGVLLQEHLSVTLATALALCISALRIDIKSPKSVLLLGAVIVSATLATIATVFSFADWIQSYDTRFVQALMSRAFIGELRIGYLIDHMLLGYGFVHEESLLGLEVSKETRGIHDLRLATVDAGYLDMLIKFGFIGTMIALWLFARFCRAMANSVGTECRALTVFIMLFFAIMLTWSVLTYIHGIVFIGLAVLISMPRPQRSVSAPTRADTWSRASA
jgi:hypothetical protein